MSTAANQSGFDVGAFRSQFPALHQQVNGYPLVYFDNAATIQKPQSVIDALVHYYTFDNANIHRGIHTLAERATHAFEETRKSAAHFLNAASTDEIIFTKGVTEGINLIAAVFGQQNLRPGDEIIISGLEHHSNIVPWQRACEASGAELKIIPVTDDGALDMDQFYKLVVPEKTKLIAVNHASNSLGTINPVEEIIQHAHASGIAVLIDGAQAAAHLSIDVQKLDCDFYVLSGHKMYAPTGTGILYGKRKWLEQLPPWQSGGEMISQVSFEKTTYNTIPYKFEAGTPNIADIVAFKHAFDFINQYGKSFLAAHENELLKYATERISEIPGIRIFGTAKEKVSVLSFEIRGMHHFDVGQLLDARGIAVRTGHHCTQPLMERLGIEGTIRASFAAYNTIEEIDRFISAVDRIAQTGIRK
jgi:cysteine desulfurase/selenocysteine lyase